MAQRARLSKVTKLLNNFTGGELSPRLDGRVDITKFANGCKLLENFIVLSHGGARKRSGTKFVIEQKSAIDDVVLVPFQYNIEQSYMLLFGPNYVWFLKDQGTITFPSVTITGVTQNTTALVTAPAHGFANGDRVIIQNVSGMTELNNRHFIAAGVTTNTFQLTGINSTGYSAYTSSGTASEIVELTTTYGATEVADLTFAQSADTLYIAHKDHPLRKITRSSHTSWTLEQPSLTTGPFRSINGSRTNKITCSSFSASATSYGTHIVGETFTMTAVTSGTFTSGMVGGLFRLNEEGGATGIRNAPLGDTTQTIATNQIYTNEGRIYGIAAVSVATTWVNFNRVPAHDAGTVRVNGSSSAYFDSDFLHPGYCVVRITAYASSTSVTAQIVRYQMPASIVTSGTTFWEEGAWSAYRGFARAIAFYEQRLFMAGSNSDPSVLWGSRSAAYEDFEDGTDDDDALVYRIASGLADTIRWLSSGRVLTTGSSNGEYAIAASNQNQALTPSNFKANPQTSYGTSSCPPIRINQAVLYPQRSGDPSNTARKLREFAYAYESDSFNSTDLTVFSEHIFGNGITRLAYQTEPDSLIWASRSDGELASCTYERTQEVIAWHRHVLGGENAQVNTIGVIPGNNGDELWLSASRFIGDVNDIGILITESGETLTTEDDLEYITDDTQTTRYIEVLQAPFRDMAEKDDAFFVDSGLTYSGVSTTTISGLWHLRGVTVNILNNGNVETATVTSAGRLALARETTKAHIGLGYTAKLETEDLEAGAQAGTAQSRAKRISQIFLRVLNSLGGTFGPDETTQKTVLYRMPAMPQGSSPPLFSGMKELDFPSGWEREARVRVEHSDPLPMHVTGIVAELNVVG